jgi:predicted phosphodiesterase
MKNFCNTLIFSLVFFFSANAQSKSRLEFNKNGEFKILQFTDTHIELKDTENLEAYTVIEKVMEFEKPELVVLTGDIVTEDNPQEAILRLASIFEKAKTPWAMVFGNHESEHNLSRKELAGFVEKLPFCLNNDKGETHGYSNFILPVNGKENKPAALLYCMDSNEYSTLEPTVGGWGWFDHLQVNWYREKSREWKRKNNGKPMPALAFFHIPLPEYTDAWNNKTTPSIGVKNEDECSPVINTGMFAAMLECGDVMGTFVGHDHINDYIGVHYGIALAYGRVSKVMKDAEDPLAGGRVIVMKEGKREFDTWIRDMNGNKVLECNLPRSFTAVKPNK